MTTQRDLSIATMIAVSEQSIGKPDFMAAADIPMPQVLVPGSLPATVREGVPATQLQLKMNMVMQWSLGDFAQASSRYYDPDSPWYNVIYGAYGMQSLKPDGSPWGFNKNGEVNWDEFFQLTEVDYNWLTAGQFGCPPSMMSFAIHERSTEVINGWQFAETLSTIPSGLHDYRTTIPNPSAYLLYGIPDTAYIAKDHSPYEPVKMRGHVYMRQMTTGCQPITLAFGVTCPDTLKGQHLREGIMKELWAVYSSIRVKEKS